MAYLGLSSRAAGGRPFVGAEVDGSPEGEEVEVVDVSGGEWPKAVVWWEEGLGNPGGKEGVAVGCGWLI